MWFQQITHTGVACVTLCLIYLCARTPLYTVCVWYLAKQSAICRLFPTFVLTHKENEVGWLHSSRAWIDTFLKYVNKSVQKKHSDWTAATVWTRAAVFLTFCAEARAGGEAGHIDDLYSKLLACVPVNAAPHHTEGTPATHTHTHRGNWEHWERRKHRVTYGNSRRATAVRKHSANTFSMNMLQLVHISQSINCFVMLNSQ